MDMKAIWIFIVCSQFVCSSCLLGKREKKVLPNRRNFLTSKHARDEATGCGLSWNFRPDEAALSHATTPRPVICKDFLELSILVFRLVSTFTEADKICGLQNW
jgi:hypothetical protein